MVKATSTKFLKKRNLEKIQCAIKTLTKYGINLKLWSVTFKSDSLGVIKATSMDLWRNYDVVLRFSSIFFKKMSNFSRRTYETSMNEICQSEQQMQNLFSLNKIFCIGQLAWKIRFATSKHFSRKIGNFTYTRQNQEILGSHHKEG